MMAEWEALCRRCGRCCFEKRIEEDGTVVETDQACRYLDVVSRRCKVYHKRFEVEQECVRLDPQTVREAFWLPRDCGYVVWLSRTAACQPAQKRVSKKRQRPVKRRGKPGEHLDR